MKSFTAVLEPLRSRLNWVIARIPFDVAKAWPSGGACGCAARSRPRAVRPALRLSHLALSPPQAEEGHFLLVNKKMQKAAAQASVLRVRIRLEPDMEERAATLPPELARALKGDRRLPKWFAGLSYSTRKEIGDWIAEPKNAELR
jgi:hypothetical protein